MQEQRETRGPCLAILSYHKVGDPPRGAWEPWYYVPDAMLAEQLAALREDGWEFIDVSSALRGLADPTALPARSALITFDDGYRSVLERGLPVLRKLGAPAVMFVPAALVGGVGSFDQEVSEPLEPLCGWEELHELADSGVSIQSHGLEHVHLSDVGADLLETELARSKRIIEDGLGQTVEMFAFPYGDGGSDPATVSRSLERCGYRAACLYGGGPVPLPAENPYRLSRIPVGYETDVVAELTASC